MIMFGIMDKYIGKVVYTYHSVTQKNLPLYTDVKYEQFVMEEVNGEYWHIPKAYNYFDGTIFYNTEYAPSTPTYILQKREELIGVLANFREFMLQTACENSMLLNNEIGRLAMLGQINPYDPVQVATLVRGILDPFSDALEPLVRDFEKYYFWRIDHWIDLMPHEPVLASEERIAEKVAAIKVIAGQA